MKRSRECTASALAIACCMAFPAQAQTAQDDEPTTVADSRTGLPSEIIVTGNKRDQSLVDVPISVQVFTDEVISDRGITGPADFLNTTPNVVFIADNAGEVFVNIRGQTGARNGDPNVAIVIDGVTLSTLKPFNQDLFAVEQIEVLKGPQSALYGRNAAAGAIIINTKKPTDVMEGEVVASYANHDSKRLSANVSGPMSEQLGFALAGSYRDTDGPFKSITTGENVLRNRVMSGRGRLVFDNGEGFTIDAKMGINDTKGGGIAYNAHIAGAGIGGLPVDRGIDANYVIDFVSDVRGIFEETFWDATLKTEYDMGFATLTAIGAYNNLDQYYGSDGVPYVPDTGTPGATVQQYTIQDESYSGEMRLTSPGDQRFRWQVGFYYLRYDRNQTSHLMADTLGVVPETVGSILPPSSDFPTVAFGNPFYKTTSYAPFGNFEFDVTDKLTLAVAGRYDTEKRSVRELTTADINPLTGASYNLCVALTGRSLEDCYNSRTFKAFQPKVSVTYKFTPEVSAYASYGKGFKSGGFNPIGSREALRQSAIDAGADPDSVFVEDQYDKEVSKSWEVGLKTQLFSRMLSFNVAAFKTDVTGAQQFDFSPSVGLQTIVEIDKVKLKGLDADFNLNTPGGLNVYGSAGYVHGRIAQFDGNPAFVDNVSPKTYEYTFSLGVAQDIALADTLTLVPRLEFTRFGPFWQNANNTPGTRRDPLSLLKGRLSLRSEAGWEISAFGDNLTNEKYYQEIVPLLGFFSVNYRGPTRSYGVEVRKSF